MLAPLLAALLFSVDCSSDVLPHRGRYLYLSLSSLYFLYMFLSLCLCMSVCLSLALPLCLCLAASLGPFQAFLPMIVFVQCDPADYREQQVDGTIHKFEYRYGLVASGRI